MKWRLWFDTLKSSSNCKYHIKKTCFVKRLVHTCFLQFSQLLSSISVENINKDRRSSGMFGVVISQKNKGLNYTAAEAWNIGLNVRLWRFRVFLFGYPNSL